MTSHFPDHAFLASRKVGIMKNRSFMEMGSADDVITEANLKRAYGSDIRVVYLGGDIGRKVTVPMIRSSN